MMPTYIPGTMTRPFYNYSGRIGLPGTAEWNLVVNAQLEDGSWPGEG